MLAVGIGARSNHATATTTGQVTLHSPTTSTAGKRSATDLIPTATVTHGAGSGVDSHRSRRAEPSQGDALPNTVPQRTINKHSTLRSKKRKPLAPRIPDDIATIIRTAVDRATIFSRLTSYGIWHTHPLHSRSPDEVTLQALAYLRSVFPLYDTARAEDTAYAAGVDLFHADPDALVRIRQQHTASVVRHGLLPTIASLQSECSFGFTADRCKAVFSGDPDFPRLFSIANSGATKDLPHGFIKQPTILPQRPVHTRVLPAIQWHAIKMARDSQALLLSRHELPDHDIQALHHSNITWQAHPEKPLGRFCNDNTAHDSGHALNTPWTKVAADERWGVATCPTIATILEDILRVASLAGVAITEIFLFKDDVSKAFNQIKYDPATACLYATSPDGDTIMIQVRLVFGGNDSAQIFDCVGRALERLIQADIAKMAPCTVASVQRYVDDIMGFSTRAFSHAVKQCVHERVCQTFGPSGINAGKSIEPAQEADLIGYIVNTKKGTVRPNLKCLHKLFIAFFCTDIRPNVPVSLRDRQVLASLVCRGAQVMRGMSPFVQCFYGWLAGNQFCPRPPSSQILFAVEMWRATLIASFHDHSILDVPFSFALNRSLSAPSSWDYMIQTDASELGTCLSVWDHTHSVLLAWTLVRFPWGKDHEVGPLARSAQNMREYCGYCFALIFLHSLPTIPSRNAVIHWQGDNNAALTWVSTWKCGSRNPACQRIFMAITILEQTTAISLSRTSQIKSEDMGDVDLVSRGHILNLETLTPDKMVDTTTWVVFRDIMVACNPFLEHDLEQHHREFLRVSSILTNIPNTPVKPSIR